MCIILYDDRINTYHRMLELDLIVDKNTSKAIDLVEARIRNKQADDELLSYNSSGTFLNQHPFVKSRTFFRSQYDELLSLSKNDPDKFIKETININKSISRYELYIKENRAKTPEQLEKWKNHLIRFQARKNIVADILKK